MQNRLTIPPESTIWSTLAHLGIGGAKLVGPLAFAKRHVVLGLMYCDLIPE